MHDTARDLSAQLDSKMAALQHLVREAERVATRLEAAIERAQEQVPLQRHGDAERVSSESRGCAASSAGPEGVRPIPSQPLPDRPAEPEPSPVAETPVVPYSPANQAQSLRSSEPSGDGKSSLTKPSTVRSSAEVRYQEIYILADYGYPPSEIAQRVGNPVGEVELILSLRDSRQ